MMITIVGPNRDSRGCWNGRAFAPAGHHQPGVGVALHAVRRPRRLQRRGDAGAVEADVEVDRPRRLEQPVEVVVEERPAAVDAAAAPPRPRRRA